MLITLNPKLCFIDIPKCASQSIKAAMIDRFQAREIGHHSCEGIGAFMDHTWFAVKRHPYDRAVSLWWSTCQRNPDSYGIQRAIGYKNPDMLDFMKWLNACGSHWTNAMLRPQYYFLPHQHYKVVWIRYEALDEDFKRLIPFWDIETLPEINVTRDARDATHTYLTSQIKNLVCEWAKDDFKYFKFEE